MPMKQPPSGPAVRTEAIEALGLSVSKAAEISQVRRATLSDLLHGKAVLTPEMALKWRSARTRLKHLIRRRCFLKRSRRASVNHCPSGPMYAQTILRFPA